MFSMIHKIRREQWTDTGQRICLQHKSQRKLRGGPRDRFQRQITTTYLLKRHQRRRESITLPRQESRGLENMIIFRLFHAGRNIPSNSQGLTLLFHRGGEEGRAGGHYRGQGCLPGLGRRETHVPKIELKRSLSTAPWIYYISQNMIMKNFLAHISS